MRFRRVLEDLSGRSYRRTIDILVAQLDVTLRGAELATLMADGSLMPGAARAAMSEVEHEGDAQRAALVAELAAALTTPIDREDLYRLSRSVDDVLDNLRDLVRETDLYEMGGDTADLPSLTALIEGLRLLRRAVERLPDRPDRVRAATLAARKQAGRMRQHYQTALAELFRADISSDTLKRRELLRRLDVIGLRLGESADALSDAMLKRSH
jgi:uncharacterized protein